MIRHDQDPAATSVESALAMIAALCRSEPRADLYDAEGRIRYGEPVAPIAFGDYAMAA